MLHLGCRYILFITFSLAAQYVFSQTNQRIRQLEKERKELHHKISESETLLKSTGKDVKSQLDNLALITGQINERRRYLSSIQKDMNSIQLEINRLEGELKILDGELELKRKRYEESFKYMQRNSSVQEKLMFIFSADNLGQMYRRLRYVRQYADFQRLKGEEVKNKLSEIKEKKKVTLDTYNAKVELLKHQETEKKKLELKEAERKELVVSMQNKQVQLRLEIEKQRKVAAKLNSEIDRLIALEIEAAKKKEKEARRKAEEEKRKEALANKDNVAARKEEKTDRMEVYKTDSSDRQLSGTFERNKGKLPVPVTGPYVIVGKYGQYQVDGLRNVRLDNKGIDIKVKQGSMARTIFDGEVTAVFQYNGLANVLVRHGSYISVYCNLESVLVRQGSVLKTRDVIGQINTGSDGNTVLHFQLRNETAKLNPELWLAR